MFATNRLLRSALVASLAFFGFTFATSAYALPTTSTSFSPTLVPNPIRLGIASTLNAGGGLRIVGVVPGSVAQQVGLEVGDTIVSVNNTQITSHFAMQQVLDQAQAMLNGHLDMVVLNVRDGRFYQICADIQPAVVHQHYYSNQAPVVAKQTPPGFVAKNILKKVLKP